MKNILFSIIDFLFPYTCPVCKKREAPYPEPICPSCKEEFLASPSPGISSSPTIDRIFSCSSYDGPTKEVLRRFKFCNDQSMLVPIDSLLNSRGKTIIDFAPGASMIIPVPLHRSRKRKRGFNQSEALAALLSKRLGLPVCNNVLIKKKNTPPQSSLSRAERLKNLANAFIAKHPSRIENMKILLIDDVTTTGATLDSCAKTLYKAGASEVRALTIAKTL